jgi:hypothetical protein
VTGPEQLIADALRDIAADAPPPRPMDEATWRAGRRHRLRMLAAAVATGASTIVAALVLTLTAIGSPARTGNPAGPAAPLSLAKPIEFQQVAAISRHGRCRAGSGDLLPGNPPPDCIRLTGTRMTVTEVRSLRVVQARPGSWVLEIRLTGADIGRLAALTRKLVGLPRPRDQLAIIVGGIVFSHPAVTAPITNGHAEISAGYTRWGQVDAIVHHLL